MVLRPPRGPPRRAVLRRTVPGPPFWPSRLRLEGDPEGRPGSVFRPGHSRGPSRRAAKKAAKKAVLRPSRRAVWKSPLERTLLGTVSVPSRGKSRGRLQDSSRGFLETRRDSRGRLQGRPEALLRTLGRNRSNTGSRNPMWGPMRRLRWSSGSASVVGGPVRRCGVYMASGPVSEPSTAAEAVSETFTEAVSVLRPWDPRTGPRRGPF
mmetsp:Transcript_22972/g.77612  ORF Transcript_22972/g.77612 Transcript_22972/m.77612 type:complete len:208 (+) Transcript_22972:558-1181(+)